MDNNIDDLIRLMILTTKRNVVLKMINEMRDCFRSYGHTEWYEEKIDPLLRELSEIENQIINFNNIDDIDGRKIEPPPPPIYPPRARH